MSISRRSCSRFFWYDFSAGGRRHRGSTRQTEPDRAVLVEERLKRLALLHSGDARFLGPKKLVDLLDAFVDYLPNDQNLKQSSKEAYLQGCRTLRKTSLMSWHIEGISTSLIATTKIGSSMSTRAQALRALRRAFHLAMDWGLIDRVPRIHIPKEKWRMRIFTREEEDRLLEHAQPNLRDIFILLVNTGMRPRELFELRWSEILWDQSAIHVKEGKTHAAVRFVGLTPDAFQVLDRRQKARRSVWVFPSMRTASGHIESLSASFAAARRRAGLSKDLVLYSTRHTYATTLVAATGNSHLVAAQMGHVSIAHTNRYIHPNTVHVAALVATARKG